MRKLFTIIGIIFLLILFVGLPTFFTITPTGKKVWNNWFHSVQEADDETNYTTLKEVEDTCRAMIASYNNDKLIYEQYKDSTDSLERQMSNNAKTRANQTASTYNNYIIKNKYIWKNNIPADICMYLQYIGETQGSTTTHNILNEDKIVYEEMNDDISN